MCSVGSTNLFEVNSVKFSFSKCPFIFFIPSGSGYKIYTVFTDSDGRIKYLHYLFLYVPLSNGKL